MSEAEAVVSNAMAHAGELAEDAAHTIEDAGKVVGKEGTDLHARLEGAEGLLQDIVNFLHRLFPGHNAPGSPGG